MAAVSGVLFSLGEWDTAQSELSDPTADGPRPVINRAVCDAYATSLGASVINAATGPAQFGVGEFCRPYYESQGVQPPVVEPPFDGGQCPVSYSITYRVTFLNRFGQTIQANFGRQYLGPLGAPFIGSPLGSVGNTAALVQAGDGLKQIVAGDCPANINRDCPQSVEVISIARVDGQPDDCGSLPPEFTPAPNYPTPRPVGSPTTVNIGGTDVDVVISDVRTDRKGDNYVTVTGPSFEVDIPIEAPTEIIRPPEVVTGSPVDVTGDSGRQTDDLTPEEQQEGFETIGYRFDLLGLPSNVSGIPGTDPRVLTTPYGNVQLEYRTEGGLILFSDNLPIRVVSGSIVRQDTNLKIQAIRYQKRPDVSSIRLTPVRARIV